ncbi:glutamate--tRNA ligase [Motilibacter aurantiacus]|uniref:glutamate--tRNA ligase n=1 Tax=Motilibacter aurantiacus TaxID=2714955 RepID=UPI00140C23AF|nr:glutamate--tRNA ligase [Motilibacter aurantiacus]
MTDQAVRVRFCPSPTGNPHVGLVRTALFNWAYARHTGGTFVFRIEDTDAARDSEESYQALLETLRWLGLDWDEGPEVGGPHAPYRQSQRMDVYADVARRLLEAGLAYESFSTPQEVEERRRAAGQDPKLGYDNADRHTTAEQRAAYLAEGRQPVLRLRMPDTDLAFDDLVRGEVRFAAGSIPDYVIVRADGSPLYPLVNPVDDVLMGITHVLRGEDLLSSTPRQLALYRALGEIGVGTGEPPLFGHLPYVMGEGNKKLSKRDPESSIGYYRDEGFIPEGLLNYLALLGWSIAEDRDVFSLEEMVEAFDVARVNANPARFDLKKCEAINGQWIRRLAPEDFTERALRQLALDGYVSSPPTEEQRAVMAAATPLVQERVNLLKQVPEMLAFLFVDTVTVAPDAAKLLNADVLRAALEALEAVQEWAAGPIEGALNAALQEGLGLSRNKALGPLRPALTGRKVMPPMYESLELLGRERSLARIRAALDPLA